MWTCRYCGHNVTDETDQYCGHCGRPREDVNALGFDLYLMAIDPARKINVIKVVRELTNLGLKEAKDLVEQAPQPVLTNLTRENANALLQRLEDAGGHGELIPSGAQPSQSATPYTMPTSPRLQPTSGCSGIVLLMLAATVSILVACWIK